MTASDFRSGKGHNDENFPVASRLIRREHRGIILAFYQFVRTADDIADHATLTESEKLALLDSLEGSLMGEQTAHKEGVVLRDALAARAMPPDHARDILTAFRMDVTKHRYADWDDLIGYCRYSAMPVGRFVLDVHGESRATWAASDALCAALQIINHLQDCGEDYRALDRVYIPQDTLAKNGAAVEALAGAHATPVLRACFVQLASRTNDLLRTSAPLAGQVADWRLALEISVIQRVAQRLVHVLQVRDPLGETVHLGKFGALGTGLLGLGAGFGSRLGRGARA
ncbi:MAG TPA: squalene synthase HpnC [Xanthobacteraceae bacterium]|jgi:squalene synthase HpnC|nr:squalene synthase HpnC [Xanthobacteraceae bacterium]